MMEVVVSEQSISPDSAGVWHLSVTSIHQAEVWLETARRLQ